MTAIKTRPIIFSGPMVRAILDGRKAMTRRAIKPQPPSWAPATIGVGQIEEGFGFCDDVDGVDLCRYGKPCDCLYVKETFRKTFDVDGADVLEYRAGGTRLIVGNSIQHGQHRATSILPKWVSPLFMPRWASRIELEITSIRAERVQDITDADAIAEGAQCEGFPASMTNRGAFAKRWDEINGGGSWDANPWVWVVTFNRVEQP